MKPFDVQQTVVVEEGLETIVYDILDSVRLALTGISGCTSDVVDEVIVTVTNAVANNWDDLAAHILEGPDCKTEKTSTEEGTRCCLCTPTDRRFGGAVP